MKKRIGRQHQSARASNKCNNHQKPHKCFVTSAKWHFCRFLIEKQITTPERLAYSSVPFETPDYDMEDGIPIVVME
jgi:hypothetical protein